MPARFHTWESYFYPPPDAGTLRNLFDERDPAVLQEREQAESSARYAEAMLGGVKIERTFDAEHLASIHRHLFGDVYEWAGKHRTVPLYKTTPRAFADVTEIKRYLDDVHRSVRSTPWHALDRREFVEQTAIIFAHVNQAHPFREGNGRTSKLFMVHVAELSAFAFDYTRVTDEVWNNASMYSAPDLNAYEPYPDMLVPVFHAITVNREHAAEVPPGMPVQRGEPGAAG